MPGLSMVGLGDNAQQVRSNNLMDSFEKTDHLIQEIQETILQLKARLEPSLSPPTPTEQTQIGGENKPTRISYMYIVSKIIEDLFRQKRELQDILQRLEI